MQFLVGATGVAGARNYISSWWTENNNHKFLVLGASS